MLIRDADPNLDAVACAAIYAPYVSESVISLELVPPTAAEFQQRMQGFSQNHPYIVAVDDQGPDAGEIAGFAYAGPHSARGGYRWCADVSVYLHERYHRRGIGRALYQALFSLLKRQGVWIVCAGITMPNEPSEALHRSCGFELVGVYHRVAHKHGAWRDVAWLELALRPAAAFRLAEPPPEPGPPARIN